MNILPFVFYFIASIIYAVYFIKQSDLVGRIATVILVSGALAHTFVIGMQYVQVEHIPFAGTTGAISAFVWLLALAYLYTEMTTEERSMGIFVVPLMTILQIIPTITNNVSEPPAVLDSPWFAIHVSSLLFAYASFALACVVSITYVLLFKELKTKHLGVFYKRLPSLQVLDVMNGRAITVGWLFLTLGLCVGIVWLTQIQTNTMDPRVQAMSILDPKIFVVLLCWLVYSFELFARHAIGLSGRRSALLSTFGFIIVLLNFLPIGYFVTKSHNFFY